MFMKDYLMKLEKCRHRATYDFMIEEAIKLNLKVIEINASIPLLHSLEYELHSIAIIFDRIGK